MEIFAEDYRTNTFFRDLAIAEIRVAYRVMEYLSPDSVEKHKTNPETLRLIIGGAHNQEQLTKAAETIVDECGTFGEHSQQSLEKGCVMLIKKLLPGYIAVKATEKEKKRLELLKQLEDLDKD